MLFELVLLAWSLWPVLLVLVLVAWAPWPVQPVLVLLLAVGLEPVQPVVVLLLSVCLEPVELVVLLLLALVHWLVQLLLLLVPERLWPLEPVLLESAVVQLVAVLQLLQWWLLLARLALVAKAGLESHLLQQ